ncbi:MAG: archease [bacterium]|nr:archease [bacterium]
MASDFEILRNAGNTCIHATGTTIEDLFANAAKGVMSVIKPDYGTLRPDPQRTRTFTTDALDRETLLVEFLSELLASIDTKNELYPMLTITELHERRLVAEATGATIDTVDVEANAVTCSDLTIAETAEGYETTITLDV